VAGAVGLRAPEESQTRRAVPQVVHDAGRREEAGARGRLGRVRQLVDGPDVPGRAGIPGAQVPVVRAERHAAAVHASRRRPVLSRVRPPGRPGQDTEGPAELRDLSRLLPVQFAHGHVRQGEQLPRRGRDRVQPDAAGRTGQRHHQGLGTVRLSEVRF